MKIANFKCGRRGSLMKVHSPAANRKEGVSPIVPRLVNKMKTTTWKH